MRRAPLLALPVRLVLAAGTAATVSACLPQNAQACLDYVDVLNDKRVECALEEVVPEEQCPPTLDHGADCTDYYLSLKNTVRCEDGDIVYGDGDYPYLAGTGCF